MDLSPEQIKRALADYMTVADAARALAVSKARVEQFIRDDPPRLAVAFEAGGLRWVERAAVDRLRGRSRKPGRPPKNALPGGS